jgi:Histidine kinase-, DNA gyrase B-, and HSP90-like ATPase
MDQPGPAEHCPYDIADPRPEALVESLRAFGYTLPTAVADLVDNSISADAHRIWINAHWAGQDSWLSVMDDGTGMSETTMIEAMRAGSQSPRDARRQDDLGRFGLGLKTASFSQARELTVRSLRGGAVAERRWDLDVVVATGQWRLLRAIDESARELLPLPSPSGTGVLWRRVDRVVGESSVDDAKARDRFLALLEDLEKHLASTFHEYLARPKRLTIELNGRPVAAWDPFLGKHDATQSLGEERIKYKGHEVRVNAYVLPHHSRMTEAEHKLAGGERGWNAQQGFYLHRNGRLIVAGSWLGLGFTKEEHYKLARISVEIPNALDEEWQLDVRKATARPPGPLRDRLRAVAKYSREVAAEVYRHRGKRTARGPVSEAVFAWNREQKGGKIRYRINRDHPVIAAMFDGNPSRAERVAALRLIEETVPVPLIAIDHAETPELQAPPLDSIGAGEVRQMVRQAVRELRAKGYEDSKIVKVLGAMELCDRYPEVVASVLSEGDAA